MERKRTSLAKRLLLSLLLVCLVIPVARADFGPKEALYVRVVNGPDEPLYIDLLAQGDPAISGPETEGSVPDYLKQLRSLEGDGWVLAVSTGLMNTPPIFGDVTPREDGTWYFGYFGLPRTFRLAAATAGEAKSAAEPLTRNRFYTNLVYDWGANTLTYATPTPLFWAAQFAATLIPTLLIEGAMLLLFGYREKRSWLVFLVVNVVTQIGLHLACNLLMGSSVMNMSFYWMFYLFLLIPEIVIWCVEAVAYALLLRERDFTRRRAVGYAFAANIASYALTFLPLNLLYEPFTRL